MTRQTFNLSEGGRARLYTEGLDVTIRILEPEGDGFRFVTPHLTFYPDVPGRLAMGVPYVVENLEIRPYMNESGTSCIRVLLDGRSLGYTAPIILQLALAYVMQGKSDPPDREELFTR